MDFVMFMVVVVGVGVGGAVVALWCEHWRK